MATMKAVRIHEYGGPGALTYEEVPRAHELSQAGHTRGEIVLEINKR